ncbi:Olfactory Receptor 10C1 [Manis pentadactyla]|nr:Olfactory Receptor 10C1 [Manis pentadactyla]
MRLRQSAFSTAKVVQHLCHCVYQIWADPGLHTPRAPCPASCLPRSDISRTACGPQTFFFLTLGTAECVLISLISCDRYVAIRNPLRSALIMSQRVCPQTATVSWVGGALTSLAHRPHPALPHRWFHRDFPFPL